MEDAIYFIKCPECGAKGIREAKDVYRCSAVPGYQFHVIPVDENGERKTVIANVGGQFKEVTIATADQTWGEHDG